MPDGVRCKPGSCQTEWVEPSYRIHVPTYDPAACAADPDNVLVCTPFYGGRLMAHYIGGLNDTYGWEVRLPGLPYLVR